MKNNRSNKAEALDKPPADMMPFDYDRDTGLIEKLVDIIEETTWATQVALVPPSRLAKRGELKLLADVVQMLNLRTKDARFLLVVSVVAPDGISRTPITLDLYGTTESGELVFSNGDGTFITSEIFRAQRLQDIEAVSQSLKMGGFGGDITKVMNRKLRGPYSHDDDED